MDEVEYLCDSTFNESSIPNRIGVMDGGKLIELGTLQELKQKHGEGLVMQQKGDRWEYQFFPTLAAANAYLDQQSDKTGMMVRPTNLEDIFVELTGRKLD
jgi:ABC-2 type transport system ATP-binding protein